MRYIKMFENFEITPIMKLIEGINNIINYEYIDDDTIELEVKSGNDRSYDCPESIKFLIKFVDSVDSYDEFYKKFIDYEFNIECLFDGSVANYLTPEAIFYIQYYYRNID